MRIYTAWAGQADGAWMVAAECEYSYEGDPERADVLFAAAKEKAESEGWQYREITLEIDYAHIESAFMAPVIPAVPATEGSDRG